MPPKKQNKVSPDASGTSHTFDVAGADGGQHHQPGGVTVDQLEAMLASLKVDLLAEVASNNKTILAEGTEDPLPSPPPVLTDGRGGSASPTRPRRGSTPRGVHYGHVPFLGVGESIPWPNATDAKTAMQVLANPVERVCDLDLAADLLGIRDGILGDMEARFPVRSPADVDPCSGKAKWYTDTYSEKLRDKADHGGRGDSSKSPMWMRDLKYYQVLYHQCVVLQRVITMVRYSTVQMVEEGDHDLNYAPLLLLESSLKPLSELYMGCVDQLDVIRIRADESVEMAEELSQFLDASPHDHYGPKAREILVQQRRDAASALAREVAKANAKGAHQRLHGGRRGGGGGSGSGGSGGNRGGDRTGGANGRPSAPAGAGGRR